MKKIFLIVLSLISYVLLSNSITYYQLKENTIIKETPKDSLILLKDSVWSNKIAERIPINKQNEVYISISKKGEIAYYKQKPLNNKNTHSLKFDKGIHPYVWLLEGTIKDAKYNKNIKAKIEIFNLISKKIVYRKWIEIANNSFVIPLATGINYSVTVIQKGYMLYSQNYDLRNVNSYTKTKLEILLPKVEKNATSVLRNVFFNANASFFTETSKNELDRLYFLIKMHPKFNVEISGHTDYYQSKKESKELSKKRANSVANYLIKKGIKRNRFKTVGHVDTKPIIANKNLVNNRIEIKFILK